MYVCKAAHLKLIAQPTTMLETFIITMYIRDFSRLVDFLKITYLASAQQICCNVLLVYKN
jgi:hypothetical protein